VSASARHASRPEVFYIVARRAPVAPVAPVAPLRAAWTRTIVLRREHPDVIIRDERGLERGAVVFGPEHVDAARDAIARTRRAELVKVRLWLPGGFRFLALRGEREGLYLRAYDPRGVCEGPPPVALSADELEQLDAALARLATLAAPENA